MNFWVSENIKIAQFEYFLIILAFFILLDSAPALGNNTKFTDSLRHAYLRQTGKQKIGTLNKLADYYYQYDLDSVIYYKSLALQEAKIIQDSIAQFNLLVDIGYVHYDKYEKRLSRNYFIQSIHYAKKKNLHQLLFKSYTALGIYFYDLVLYDSALYYHQESLKNKEEFGNDNLSKSNSLNNIGLIYYSIKDLENALINYKNALELKLKEGDTANAVVEYHNIGLCYTAQKKYYLAIDHFNQALKIAEKSNKTWLPNIYDGLGQVYLEIDNVKNAKEYLNLAIELSKQTENKSIESSGYYYLAKLEAKNKNYEEAKKYLHKSLELANDINDKRKNLKLFELAADIFKEQNKYDSAFHYQQLSADLGDSIFNEELAKNLANIQLLRQEEESRQVIAQKEEDINQRTKLNNLLVVVLVLSLLLIIIVTRNYLQTNKINKKLSISNFKIEKQKEVLESRNKQLAEAQKTIKHQNELLRNVNSELEIAVKERTKELAQSNKRLAKAVKDLDDFIYKTSHDLRGPISTMQGIIKIGQMESTEEEAIKYFDILQNISDRANRILKKLIDVHEMYQKAPKIESIDIERSVKAAIDLANKADLAKSVQVNCQLQKKGSWNSDRTLFITIIENMLVNAFLFSVNKKAFVNLTVKNGSDDSLKLLFEDNGFGIMESDRNKVFEVFFKGSPRRSGTGLEIYAVRIAVEKLKGVIELKQAKDNTIYEITLPSNR